jgi:outer membrane protein TolC
MRLLLLSLITLGAASAQEVLRLSLDRAVQIALEPDGSARVALAEEAIRRSENQVDQARAAFLPNIDAGAQFRNQTANLRTFGFNFDFPGFSFPSVVGPFSVADLRATAQFSILSIPNYRKLAASKSALEASRADREVTRVDVTDQVARAYLASLRADAVLTSARANLDLSQALVDQAQSQKDAGVGTGIEVTRAQVQLANDRQRFTVAENDRRRTILQLLYIMGLELSMPVELTDTLTYQPEVAGALDPLIDQARGSRPELKAQRQRETTARLNVSAVEAERLPSLSAFGDYGGIGQPRLGLEQTRTVGVSVSIPIFDGGRRKARIAEGTTTMRQEQIRTRDLEQQVELEVRLAIDSLQSAQQQVETSREGLQLAENELEQARRRYQAGVAVPLEVTDAQARLTRARENQIAALYNYNLARLDLAAARGAIEEFIRP